MDKYNCFWCTDEVDFRKSIDKSPDEVTSFLKKKGYQYLTVGGADINTYGVNQTNALLSGLLSSGHYQIAQQSKGAVVLKIT